MAISDSDLNDLLDVIRSGGDIDAIRHGITMLLQGLIDVELASTIGAAPFERTEARTNQRNGSRDRTLSTKAGDVKLKIPKLRKGSFFPSILERRRRIDQALYAGVMEAYVHGVSTRKVDDLVQALGLDSGISKSEVSRICTLMDEDLESFRIRDLSHVEFPYVFLDATYLKGRVAGHVTSRAVVVATGVSMDGRREVLGIAVGDSGRGAFWTEGIRISLGCPTMPFDCHAWEPACLWWAQMARAVDGHLQAPAGVCRISPWTSTLYECPVFDRRR